MRSLADRTDAAGRKNHRLSRFEQSETAKVLSLDVLDHQHVNNAQTMANVYVAIAAFRIPFGH